MHPVVRIGNLDALDLREEFPDKSSYKKRGLDRITRIVVHHAVTNNHRSDLQSMTNVYNYHTSPSVDGGPWPGIGYHMFIGLLGGVYLVGDATEIRYHAGKENLSSYGICLLGDYTATDPHPIQIAMLHHVVDEISFGLGKTLPVVPHHAVSQTTCPGRAWEAYLASQ